MTKEEAKQLKDLIDKMTEENGEIPFLKSDDVKETTEDQYVELGSLEDGDKFQWNGYTLTVLDKNYTGDGIFVLTDEIIENRKFHDEDCEACNNWHTSTLREYLHKEFFEGLDDIDMILPFDRDLTSDDGLKDYGTCIDEVSLLTCDEYRKYRKFIDNKNDWWWTITPYSTPSSGNSRHARFVSTDGSLDYSSAFNGYIGVSPAYVFLSSLKVRRVSK